MEKNKTIEELERLAAKLAQARDDASDVANRALRENQVLKQELMPLMQKLLGMRPAEPDDLAQQTRFKQERDRLLTLFTAMRDVLNGSFPVNQFVVQWQASGALEQALVSGVANLIADAGPAHRRLALLKCVQEEEGFLRLSKHLRDAVSQHLANSGVPRPERSKRRAATKKRKRR